MIRSLHHLWRHHPVALSLFGGAALLALFFAVRLTLFSVYWADPEHRHQAPEPWMTPGYIAHSWHLPPEEVFDALGLSAKPQKRQTLEQIAADRGVDVDGLLSDLDAFLAARKATQ